MANRLSLRLMKFLVDLLYYALPVLTFICKAAFYTLIAAAAFVVIVIIL